MHGAGLMQNVKTNLKHLYTYHKKRTKINSSAKPVETKYDFPEVSEKELIKIKSDFKLKIKRRKRNEALLAFALTLTFFVILYFLLK